MIYVGIDIASQKHDYYMMQGETGTVFSARSLTIGNTEEGYKKLHADIQAFCEATGDSNVHIGLESTGIYHTNILNFLTSNHYEVTMINPILTNMARKASKVHAPKNDNLDSQTICKYLIDNPDIFQPYTLSLYHNDALKSISRKRFFIVKNLIKAKMAVNNLVQVIFPELKTLFSNIYGESAILILKTYTTPKALANASAKEVAALLHSRCKCTVEQLIAAAKTSVGVSNDITAFELVDAIEEMEHMQQRIEGYDKKIKAYVGELCPNLLSVPGIGHVTAGLIAGEIRDIHRFSSADSLVSYAGLDVSVYQSGKYTAKNMVASKKGSRYLRYALFQVARIIWQHDPVFKQYYDKKLAEGKHYYVVLGHIQKKLARVIYSLMKTGSMYITSC